MVMPSSSIRLSVGAELLRLPPVGAAYGVAGHHPVALGYRVLDGDVDVGEALEERGDEPPGLLVASDFLVGFVPDEVGDVALLDGGQVLPVYDLLPTTTR